MNDLSRRDLLRVSAAAAVVAVPMTALAGTANASVGDVDDHALNSGTSLGNTPVMFRISNASTGEVSILHGESEVVVNDRRLVAQILKAARVRQSK